VLPGGGEPYLPFTTCQGVITDRRLRYGEGLMHPDITIKERRYSEELHQLTHISPVDCVIDDPFERIIYLISKGDMGSAIGKNGEHIKRLQKTLGKRVEMVEEGGSPAELVANAIRPADISRVECDEDSHIAVIYLKKRSDVGVAIGKGGANIEKARLLCRRYYRMEIRDVSVEEVPYEK